MVFKSSLHNVTKSPAIHWLRITAYHFLLDGFPKVDLSYVGQSNIAESLSKNSIISLYLNPPLNDGYFNPFFDSNNQLLCLVNWSVNIIIRKCWWFLEFLSDWLLVFRCQEVYEHPMNKAVSFFHNIFKENKSKLSHHNIGFFWLKWFSFWINPLWYFWTSRLQYLCYVFFLYRFKNLGVCCNLLWLFWNRLL